MLADSENRFREQAQVSTTVLEGDDIVDTIVSHTSKHDLTIIGATREGLLQQFVFGVIPEQIGWRSKSTTIMAKQHQGLKSYLQRWL